MPLQGRFSNSLGSIFLVLPLLMTSITTAAATDSATYYDETDMLTDIPMVSSGSRMQQETYKSPSSVTVITSDMIAALAPTSLVDVFRLAPGFMSFFVNGSLAALSGHDLTDNSPRRLEVRVNGRSVYLPTAITVSWSSLGITPDDIERIELVRGSNVPTYGSNAIMGSVEITTKSPLQESGTHLHLTVGDKNTRNVNLRSNFDFGNGYGQLRMAHSENDGFDYADGFDGLGIPDNTPSIGSIDDNTSVDHVVFNSVFKPTLADTVHFEVGVSNGEFGVGDTDRVDEFAVDTNRSYWVTTGWSQTGEVEKWEWNFSLYDISMEQEVYKLLSDVLGVTPADVQVSFGQPDFMMEIGLGKRENTLLETELEYQYIFNENLRALIGAGYKWQSLKASKHLTSQGAIDNGILYTFSNIEWQFAQDWLINLGFMVENQEMDETNFSPRASIHYQLTPQHNFRISTSKAYRTPSILESNRFTKTEAYGLIDVELLSDENLVAEELKSIELAYYGSFFNGALTVDWRAFNEDMNGAIDNVEWDVDHQGWIAAADNVNGEVNFVSNSKNWQVSGYDIQVTWLPFTGTSIALQFANVRLDATRLRDWDDTVAQQRLFKVPEHTGSLFITQEINSSWSFSLMGYHQSYVDWRGGEEMEGFDRYDITLSKKIDFGYQQLRFDFRVENVADKNYLEYQKGNYFERAFYFKAGINW